LCALAFALALPPLVTGANMAIQQAYMHLHVFSRYVAAFQYLYLAALQKRCDERPLPSLGIPFGGLEAS